MESGGYWTYRTPSGGRILTLEEVKQANREPDFFELLKAAITAGSLGKPSIAAGPMRSQA
jgi:hypothetical protein